jgi:hypothetical protein
MPAYGAFPMFPKANRQERNPEYVTHIECPDCNGSPLRLAAQAIIIAKRDPLGPEMVDAVDDEHVSRRSSRNWRDLAINGEINP